MEAFFVLGKKQWTLWFLQWYNQDALKPDAVAHERPHILLYRFPCLDSSDSVHIDRESSDPYICLIYAIGRKFFHRHNVKASTCQARQIHAAIDQLWESMQDLTSFTSTLFWLLHIIYITVNQCKSVQHHEFLPGREHADGGIHMLRDLTTTATQRTRVIKQPKDFHHLIYLYHNSFWQINK